MPASIIQNLRNELPASTIAKLADYVVLDRFDTLRARAGHDYGNGQRGTELRNLRLELATLVPGTESYAFAELVTAIECREAFDRVSRPKIARLEGESYRRDTPATRRTRETWYRLAEETATAARRELEAQELDAEAIAELAADAIEAGELVSDKSMSDRELLAPLLEESPAKCTAWACSCRGFGEEGHD